MWCLFFLCFFCIVMLVFFYWLFYVSFTSCNFFGCFLILCFFCIMWCLLLYWLFYVFLFCLIYSLFKISDPARWCILLLACPQVSCDQLPSLHLMWHIRGHWPVTLTDCVVTFHKINLFVTSFYSLCHKSFCITVHQILSLDTKQSHAYFVHLPM